MSDWAKSGLDKSLIYIRRYVCVCFHSPSNQCTAHGTLWAETNAFEALHSNASLYNSTQRTTITTRCFALSPAGLCLHAFRLLISGRRGIPESLEDDEESVLLKRALLESVEHANDSGFPNPLPDSEPSNKSLDVGAAGANSRGDGDNGDGGTCSVLDSPRGQPQTRETREKQAIYTGFVKLWFFSFMNLSETTLVQFIRYHVV